MSDAAAPDPAHFARAVTQLGDRCRVVSSSAIYNTQGLKVIDKGVVVDARLYEKLTRHQLRQPLDQCVEADAPVNGAALREAMTAALDAEPLLAAMFAEPRLRDMMLEEVAHVPLPKPISLQLTVARETHPELWRRSLSSAATAAWLASRIDGTRHDMRMLAAAGLLHDLGMLHIDPVLMQPSIQLERAQRRQLYTHPLVSTMLLERHHEYPRPLLNAVLEHHERLDGSGYPRGSRAATQSLWGRILALTELVTALAAAEHPAPLTRLSVVLRMSRHAYDPALVSEVMTLLAAMPQSAPVPGNDRAASDLAEIGRLLQAWPSPDDVEDLRSDGHKGATAHVHDQCAQVLRLLADAGATAAQIGSLDEGSDPELASEIALICSEVAWQLRIVARQARRRWALGEHEAYPGWMSEWLAAVDTLCARCLGTVEASAHAAEAEGATAAVG